MDFHSSPRINRIKTIGNQITFTHIESMSPIHYVKGYKESRSSSLADGKKVAKNYGQGLPKSFRTNKPKFNTVFNSLGRITNSPASQNLITNFVNETKEIKILRAENLALKKALASGSSAQKKEFENQIKALQIENNAYKEELIRLAEFVTSHNEANFNFKLEVCNLLKTKQLENDFSIKNIIQSVENMKGFDKNFDFCDDNRKADELTGRFQSLNEADIANLISPYPEVIALEDIKNEGFLQVQAGDRVQIVSKPNEIWWIGKHNSKTGKIPVKSVLID